MKAKITLLTLFIVGSTAVSCRCDFEEDEPRNRNNQTIKQESTK